MTHIELRNWIKKCEGFRQHPYMDITQHVTIGYGRNLDDRGITPTEAEMLLANDIADAKLDLSEQFWYHYQPEAVKDALTNMCFNLGLKRFLTFKKMISALIVKDFTTAARECLDSKWASQVGDRAKDIAVMIRESK